jgi:hypothetical protein
VREVQGDWSAGEHHERERGFGGVKAVGAANDQADLVVERLGASLVDAEADRREDAVAVLAERPAEPDEGSSRQRASRLSSRSMRILAAAHPPPITLPLGDDITPPTPASAAYSPKLGLRVATVADLRANVEAISAMASGL